MIPAKQTAYSSLMRRPGEAPRLLTIISETEEEWIAEEFSAFSSNPKPGQMRLSKREWVRVNT